MRDEVLGVVAHDLRNPLSVITMAANSLSQRFADSSAHKSIERIVRSAQRANRLIQDLLDISAIGVGRFAVEKRRIEMADVILAAIESQQSLASAASIILESDVSPELRAGEVVERGLRFHVFHEVSDCAFDALIIGIHCHVSVGPVPTYNHPNLAYGGGMRRIAPIKSSVPVCSSRRASAC